MDKEEAKTVIRTIRAYYPNFMADNDREVARIWMYKLMKGNFEMTMAKLDHYAEKETFAPKLAHILYIEPKEKVDSEMIASIEQVEREKSDPELSRQRDEKLKKLSVLLKGGASDE
ncbi:hypothetical protein [Salinicoccus carnicancri]|uniref:hypothetical protein n=1 Tax=Salinicoccus carnicancri TaxID=558170 RepID=UPI000311EC15|nr:hypothetical protein [Salinicoccus carnicancri]